MTTEIHNQAVSTPSTPSPILPFRTTAQTGDYHSLLNAAKVDAYIAPVRMMLLAYGFLRGKPYRVLEPTAHPLFEKMGYAESIFLRDLVKLIAYGGMTTTEQAIQQWMAVPESAERATKRLRKETAARELRAARRATYDRAKVSAA